MTNQVIEGFDVYPINDGGTNTFAGTYWIAQSNTPSQMSVQNTQFANGTASLRWQGNFNLGRVRQSIPHDQIYAWGGRLYYASYTSNGSQNFFGLGIVGASAILSVRVNESGQISLRRGTTTIYTSALTNPIANGVWNYIDCVYNQNTGQCAIYLNNNFLDMVNGITAIGTITDAHIGSIATGGGAGGNNYIYVDDCYWNSGNDRWGETAVILGKTVANGPNQDWTPNGVTDGYEALDNVPAVTNQYIESSNVGDISNFEISALPPGVFQVMCVDHMYRAQKTTTGDGDMRGGLIVNGTVYPGANNTLTEAIYNNYRDKYLVNPDTGMSWVPSDFASQGQVLVDYERTL